MGWPTSPRTTSGSAVAAKASWSSRSWTWKVIVRRTGAERPSVTEYATCTGSPPSRGAVKRTRPSEVVRATAPDCSPPTAAAESSTTVSPSESSRQSESTGTDSAPAAGTRHTRGL